MVVKSFSVKLKEVGLSQAWAARQLGVTAAYLNRVVAGAMVPSSELCEKMVSLTSKLRSSGLTKAI